MSITKSKPAPAIGDRHIVLIYSAWGQEWGLVPTGARLDRDGVIWRVDERHPCGAIELVCIGFGEFGKIHIPEEDDGA